MPRKIALHPGQAAMMASMAPICGCVGGVGCLDPHTKIGEALVGDLSHWTEVATLFGPAAASPSFLKGKADLYLVQTESGREVVVEEHHRFLTTSGWLPLACLCIGSLIAVDGAEGDCQQLQTAPGYPQNYCTDFHLCGGQCTSLEFSPLAQEVSELLCAPGGACPAYSTYAHPYTGSSYFRERGNPTDFAFVRHNLEVCDAYARYLPHTPLPNQPWIPQRDTSGLFLPSAEEWYSGDGAYGLVETQLRGVFDQPVFHSDQSVPRFGHSFDHECACQLPVVCPFNDASYTGHYTPHFEKVKSISWHHYGEYYDLQVPATGHYLAQGIYHHNSGKSFIGVLKARAKIQAGLDGAIVAPDFPHFARSTWQTMEEWLPWSYCTNKDLNHPYTREQVLRFNINGKEVKVWYGSMENVDAWTGMNLNWFFFDEIKREKTRYALDILLGRLRVGQWPQGFFATSPLGKSHWLYDLCMKETFNDSVADAFRALGYTGKLVEWWHLRTEDNKDNLAPTYYAMLKGLYTGKMAAQELEGEFVSMEGVVWEEFSDKIDDGNVTEAAEYIHGVPIEWWVDDGFTKGHPRVILLAQVIPPYINIFDEYIRENEYPDESISRALRLPYSKPSVAYIDSSAAVLRSKLWDYEIDTVKSTHEIEQGILKVGPFIKDGEGIRHLRIHPRCKRTISDIQNYTRDEDTSKPAKLGDDVCLSGDTLVDTIRGLVKIQDITLHDYVATRCGYKQVLGVGLTKRNATVITAHFSDGTSLTGTPNHKVWTDNRGFVPLVGIESKDKLCLNQRQLSSTVKSTGDTQTQSCGQNACTLHDTYAETGIEHAQKYVVHICERETKQDVYNITVDGAHEFFASGVLVANCDAIRYGIWRKDLAEIKELGIGARKMDSAEITEKNPIKAAQKAQWDRMTETEQEMYRWMYQYR